MLSFPAFLDSPDCLTELLVLGELHIGADLESDETNRMLVVRLDNKKTTAQDIRHAATACLRARGYHVISSMFGRRIAQEVLNTEISFKS
jgi:hypothetical protein